ncbi:hypothetical protein VST7929_01496 [Vibrio stylophorae]|uniref:Uncharacterized protein n=1 Tax=Vibrio stylophorae TaxID=659351 RepID=A0ABN8DUM0_9VIBR|nr:hypothetical protein [Vibrio stylophorae]CAH0533625.1 hypothetical protein VST7929_01496 [Vibrio stylophorae]
MNQSAACLTLVVGCLFSAVSIAQSEIAQSESQSVLAPVSAAKAQTLSAAQLTQVQILFWQQMAQSTQRESALCEVADLKPWLASFEPNALTHRNTLALDCAPVLYHKPTAEQETKQATVIEHWDCQTKLSKADSRQTLDVQFAVDLELQSIYQDSWRCR